MAARGRVGGKLKAGARKPTKKRAKAKKKRASRTPRTAEKKAPPKKRSEINAAKRSRLRAAFLEALEASGGNISRSCEETDIGRRTVYDWREADADFAAAWDQAVDRGVDVLEDELRRRALHGVEEPVFYRGKRVATVRRYNDTLLMFYLNGRRPEIYRRRALDPPPPPGDEQERARKQAELVRGMLSTIPEK